MAALDRFAVAGRAAVVTGSGRGIGSGIALALAEAGADVVVTGRDAAAVEHTVAAVRATGREGLAHPGDLLAPGFVTSLAERAVAEFGRLDIWVNNAGGADEKTVAPLLHTSDDTFRAMIELNLTAVFRGAKAAAERMTRGGSIVNIASGAGMRPAPNTGAYGAAKAGVLNLTSTMAVELAPAGIRVNAVSPGPVPTDSFRRVLDFGDEQLADLAGTVPLGRLGTTEDIALAVLYLSSPAASWVTGQNLLVSGGREGGRSVEHR